MKILIIAPDAAYRSILKEHISKRPEWFVSEVADIAAATLLLEKEKVDVILLDLNLTDSFGLDTFTKIHEVAKETAIVIISDIDDEEIAVKAIQAGATDYIFKVDMAHLTLARIIRLAEAKCRFNAKWATLVPSVTTSAVPQQPQIL